MTTSESITPRVRNVTFGLVNRAVKTVDALTLLVAAVLARPLSEATLTDITWAQSLLLGVLAVIPLVQINESRRVYRWERYRSLRGQVVDVVLALIIATAVTGLFAVVFLPDSIVESWLAAFALGALVLQMTGRAVARLMVAGMETRGALKRRVAVIGAGEEGEAAIRYLAAPGHRDLYELIGVFDDRATRRAVEIAGLTVTHGVDDLVKRARQERVDVVIIALPWRAGQRIAEMMRKLCSIPADVLLPIEADWINLRGARLFSVGGLPFLQVARRPLKGSDAILKSILDYIVAGTAIALLSPLLLTVAIMVKVDSPGPILFRQRRVGFNGRDFDMFKFRSMTVDPTDDGSRGTPLDNPRITRIGRFIRRTSIDELPQLFNVLRGEMSVVGPRAHVPNMLVGERTYFETVQEYAARHRVKPGITGWGQINGMRGGIHDADKAKRGVELDLQYIENWTLWFDIRIMVRTLFGGMAGRDVF
ncbi:hypothetical protein GCM10011505_09470 [Tistrella bauzanensis]|uniref:Bacterial sugar transferase domain-containing protein n=1 Tax=Tistrella bauzanensis TaxID=657419 RepID=A0ABQ1IBM0_9PROT|nr:undecaprenyl-phosphate glucose phosphotransferase [Tistrella bauzanensis]GGB30212.1 hypothetical protein GCM10011505_09470 [Tistrella bauzanensis]